MHHALTEGSPRNLALAQADLSCNSACPWGTIGHTGVPENNVHARTSNAAACAVGVGYASTPPLQLNEGKNRVRSMLQRHIAGSGHGRGKRDEQQLR
jgi:hypothetical protein